MVPGYGRVVSGGRRHPKPGRDYPSAVPSEPRWFRGYLLATTVLFFGAGIFGFIVTIGFDDSIAGRITRGHDGRPLQLRGSATSPSADGLIPSPRLDVGVASRGHPHPPKRD
jgi:hypothetical protein